MKTRQRASRSLNKKYKNKYVSVKDIFNTIKSGIRIKSVRTSRMLTYTEYYKVPILDDEYTKVIWDRPYKFSKHKILPLKRFKEAIKK